MSIVAHIYSQKKSQKCGIAGTEIIDSVLLSECAAQTMFGLADLDVDLSLNGVHGGSDSRY